RRIEAWRAAQPAAARVAPEGIRQLVLAADQFVVGRARRDGTRGVTVVAGYPWFTDWGRDTMIALPGLALVTGRPDVARQVLETFASYVDRGMLPNVFDEAGTGPAYDSVDAPLWLFQAVRAYAARGDDALLVRLAPVLEGILAAYARGTRHGIGVDPADGLLRQGEAGVALTWMDARVNGVPVTPRIGKPVEINVLWHAALATMASLAPRAKRDAGPYATGAARVREAFARFWNPATGHLFDVLDGPDGDDATLRPNQLFALSVEDSPLDPAHRAGVLAACERALATSYGVRTRAPGTAGYHGRYLGDRDTRDRAYHQGTAWTWLLPQLALARLAVHGDRERALAALEPIATLVAEYGLGSLPEIVDGDPPHAPRGCFAQAWSVAETLRAWHAIAAAPARRATRAARRRSRARTRA
ncbi:MAG TPA: amylo-alpha-1,6-glucosidase, partial [Candidatus Eisenbacteria bacterium]|nr:amylo-alpha-1,6-glucosidase [Candidatus Eisenbacteria bacterium]